jgi:hypothetical protein
MSGISVQECVSTWHDCFSYMLLFTVSWNILAAAVTETTGVTIAGSGNTTSTLLGQKCLSEYVSSKQRLLLCLLSALYAATYSRSGNV